MKKLKQEPRVSQKINAINLLHPEKIIGHREDIGVYNLDSVIDVHTKQWTICKKEFELNKSVDENYMRFSFVNFHLKHLMGEVLTTIEASIQDEKQLNAVKSIIKNYFSKKLGWIFENCACPEDRDNSLLEE